MTDAGRPRALYLLGHSPFPPVTGGGRRAASIVEALSERYDVAVLAADDVASPDPAWAGAARRLVERRHIRTALVRDTFVGLLRGQHILLVRSMSAGVLDAFREQVRIKQPDLVVLGRPFVGPYLDVARAVAARVVVDADETMPRVAFALARSRHATFRKRMRALIEGVFVLGRMERSSYPKASQVWVSSESERASFAALVPPAQIHAIPNVMSTPDSAPEATPVSAVAFVGSYFYPPNETAALELISSVMPVVRARGGPRRLVLIGPDASPALRGAAARDPETELLGQVPEVRGPLRSAGVMAVPLRAGGGTRIKILEAFAAGVPVVSTRLGIEGLDVTEEAQILVAETAEEFADQIIRVAADTRLRDRLVRAGFDYVAEHHSNRVLRTSIAEALGWDQTLIQQDRPP
jgi:glycosyltransferase involved in cell wall biosynthesis